MQRYPQAAIESFLYKLFPEESFWSDPETSREDKFFQIASMFFLTQDRDTVLGLGNDDETLSFYNNLSLALTILPQKWQELTDEEKEKESADQKQLQSTMVEGKEEEEAETGGVENVFPGDISRISTLSGKGDEETLSESDDEEPEPGSDLYKACLMEKLEMLVDGIKQFVPYSEEKVKERVSTLETLRGEISKGREKFKQPEDQKMGNSSKNQN